MSMSKIEWTEQTWNPIVGCSIVSPGCTHCYAMRMAARIESTYGNGNAGHYLGTTKKVNGNAVWTGKLEQAPEKTLTAPLRRKTPTTYFVNSMGDLFHESCPDEWIDRVFAVMALCPRHTFQILTKRAARMRNYLDADDREELIGVAAGGMLDGEWIWKEGKNFRKAIEDIIGLSLGVTDDGGFCENDLMPLPNAWFGVSCERQQEADERIPLLLQTPAAIRFISAEPLLGPILFHECLGDDWLASGKSGERRGLDWVIVGGESGPKARPMNPEWAAAIRDRCIIAGVPFFFKQWGEWTPTNTIFGEYERVGKKAAGRRLDGREWNEMPGVAS